MCQPLSAYAEFDARCALLTGRVILEHPQHTGKVAHDESDLSVVYEEVGARDSAWSVVSTKENEAEGLFL